MAYKINGRIITNGKIKYQEFVINILLLWNTWFYGYDDNRSQNWNETTTNWDQLF